MFPNKRVLKYLFNIIISVNSPSIAGTGRVGPRQRSRITYSSHSDVEATSPDTEPFSRPKSYEDKLKGVYHENPHKSSNSRKSQLLLKKKDFSNKSPYFCKKEIRKEDENLQKYHETESSRKEHKESQKSYQSKSQKLEENVEESLQDDKIVTTSNEKESNIISSGESNMNNIEIKNKDNQNGNLCSYINERSEIHADKEGEANLQNLDLPASEINTNIKTCEKDGKDNSNELSNIQAVAISEYGSENITNLTISLIENDKNENKYVENLSYDTKDIKETVMENKDHNSKQTKEILSDNCDNKQTKNMNEQENNIKHDVKSSLEEKKVNSVMIPFSSDIDYITEQSDKLKSKDIHKALKEEEILGIKDDITGKKINTVDKQDITKCINETQNNNEKESNVANSVIVDKIESLKDLHVEKKSSFK